MSVGARASDQSLGQLVSNVTTNVSSIVRLELELAKAELATQAKQGATGVAMFVVAAFLALMALVLGSFAAVYGFEHVMPLWAAFLVVAGIYLVVGGLLAFLGARRLRRIRGPERAKAQIDLTKDALTHRSS